MTTEQQAHTPGPWTVQEYESGGGRIGAEDGALVAAFSMGANPADTRLIAAAPDLLAAAQELVNRADSDDDERDALRIADVFTLIDLVLRPAIEKATGQ